MTIIPITQAASRRNALRLALGGAAIVALPSARGVAAAPASDPDKLLRWHAGQLDIEFAEYSVALKAFYAVAMGVPLREARRCDVPGSDAETRGHYRALRDLQAERWRAVSHRCEAIWPIRPHTLVGLSVKARAMQIRVGGLAEASAAALSLNLDPTELEYWPASRMLDLVADVMAVAAEQKAVL